MAIGQEPDENFVLAMENKNERIPSISDGALLPPRRFRRSCQGCCNTFAQQQPRASKLSVARLLRHIHDSGARASKPSAEERSLTQRAAIKMAVWLYTRL